MDPLQMMLREMRAKGDCLTEKSIVEVVATAPAPAPVVEPAPLPEFPIPQFDAPRTLEFVNPVSVRLLFYGSSCVNFLCPVEYPRGALLRFVTTKHILMQSFSYGCMTHQGGQWLLSDPAIWIIREPVRQWQQFSLAIAQYCNEEVTAHFGAAIW